MCDRKGVNAKAAVDAGLVSWLTQRVHEAAVSLTGRVPEAERSPPPKPGVSFYTELFRALWALCIAGSCTTLTLVRVLYSILKVLSKVLYSAAMFFEFISLDLTDDATAQALDCRLLQSVSAVLATHLMDAELVRAITLLLLGVLNEGTVPAILLLSAENRTDCSPSDRL